MVMVHHREAGTVFKLQNQYLQCVKYEQVMSEDLRGGTFLWVLKKASDVWFN